MSEEDLNESGMEESVAEDSVADIPDATESSPVDAGDPSPQQDVWGHFRNLPEFQGQQDEAIARRLYEAMQGEAAAQQALAQYQSLIPVASEYLNNREAFEQWKTNQSQPQQYSQPAPQQQSQPQSWWNPPKITDSDKRYLTRDENGREVISENAPFDVQQRLRDYQQYRADFAEKLLNSPEEALGPMVEKVAMERAQAIVDSKVERMQAETYVSGLEKENSDWLYDEKGNVSPEGLAVQKYIQDAKAMGIDGPQARWNYATRMVERDLLLAHQQQLARNYRQAPPQRPMPQQPPQPTQAQQNMDYLRQQAMRTASNRTAVSTDARKPTAPMTFEERLLADAQEQGLI